MKRKSVRISNIFRFDREWLGRVVWIRRHRLRGSAWRGLF
jgi:hypothetical protein